MSDWIAAAALANLWSDKRFVTAVLMDNPQAFSDSVRHQLYIMAIQRLPVPALPAIHTSDAQKRRHAGVGGIMFTHIPDFALCARFHVAVPWQMHSNRVDKA